MAQVVNWVPNEVGRLLEEADGLLKEITRIREKIDEIQARCDHDFVITYKPDLQESNVQGVYVAFAYDQSEISTYGERPAHVIRVLCKRCSTKEKILAAVRCVNCFGEMVEFGDLEPREKYFISQGYPYYAARLRRCNNNSCNFTVVYEECRR